MTSSSSREAASRSEGSSGAWTASSGGRTSASRWAAGSSARCCPSERGLHPHTGGHATHAAHPTHAAAVMVPATATLPAAQLLCGDDVVDPEDHVRDLVGGLDRLALHPQGFDDLRGDHVPGAALLHADPDVL